MSAHQCPRCELMFSFRTEVEYHVASDHRRPAQRPEPTETDAEESQRQTAAPVGAP